MSPSSACKLGGVIPVANKVEDYEQFEAAGNLGYPYFQGFFFGRDLGVIFIIRLNDLSDDGSCR